MSAPPPPGPNARLLALLAVMEPLGPQDSFPDIDDPPPAAVLRRGSERGPPPKRP